MGTGSLAHCIIRPKHLEQAMQELHVYKLQHKQVMEDMLASGVSCLCGEFHDKGHRAGHNQWQLPITRL